MISTLWDQCLIEQTALTPVWGVKKDLSESFRIVLQRAAATRGALNVHFENTCD